MLTTVSEGLDSGDGEDLDVMPRLRRSALLQKML